MICPCCRKDTVNYKYDICPVCGWEYDPVQNSDPDYAGGANALSLKEYIKAYNEGSINALYYEDIDSE